MRERLAEIGNREANSRALAERALALPEVRQARALLVCRSFGIEPDTAPLNEGLLTAGKRLVLPRIAAGSSLLTLHPWDSPLETLPFGLEQPTAAAPEIDPARIDLALLVGLGFDSRGFRLGHGGGYFDRFLAATGIVAIGLAFEAQLIDRLPAEDHDLRMTAIVTEADVRRPAESDRGP